MPASHSAQNTCQCMHVKISLCFPLGTGECTASPLATSNDTRKHALQAQLLRGVPFKGLLLSELPRIPTEWRNRYPQCPNGSLWTKHSCHHRFKSVVVTDPEWTTMSHGKSWYVTKWSCFNTTLVGSEPWISFFFTFLMEGHFPTELHRFPPKSMAHGLWRAPVCVFDKQFSKEAIWKK